MTGVQTCALPIYRLLQALGRRSVRRHGPDGVHADEKLVLPRLRLEIIRGLAFVTGGRTIRVATHVSRRWRGLPVGSPEGWAVAYALLGREAKSERLLGWLERRGADAARVDELLAEPLPAGLAGRLRRLIRRSP